MQNLISISKELQHRSKERIRKLGEVFTPDAYAEEILGILTRRGAWHDLDVTFFEPTCGHGNIVVSIFNRRLEAIYKNALAYEKKDEVFFSLANTINTLWAVDIDPKNINQCRARVLHSSLEFIKTKKQYSTYKQLFLKHNYFLAHLLCAINWHIFENDALSGLSSGPSSKSAANQTKTSSKWFSQNGHCYINFDRTWTSFFAESKKMKTLPIDFQRASAFIRNYLSGFDRGLKEFDFARELLLENGFSSKKVFSETGS